MTKLRLPDHKAPFIDPQAGREYRSPGVYEIPGRDVLEYIEAGWSRPDDASGYVDRGWQGVVSDVKSGAHDSRLDELERAERARTSRPSVLGEIDDRRERKP